MKIRQALLKTVGIIFITGLLGVSMYLDSVSAQRVVPGNMQALLAETTIDGSSLSASPTFDANYNMAGLNQASLFINMASYATATELQMVCDGYLYQDATAYSIQVLSAASPSTGLPSYDRQWKKTVTSNGAWIWNIPVNYDFLNCTFTATGASTEIITVKIRAGGI